MSDGPGLSTDLALVGYYAARAAEYEKVYAKPERQRDLAQLHELIPAYFNGRHVLEVACGTGYWTRRLATHAAGILACDLAEETLALARLQHVPPARALFYCADAFDLSTVPGTFDAAFAGFWWSHLRNDAIARFLKGLHARLPIGGRVMFLDNRYVEGSNLPVTRIDSEGNTYQMRRLDNGNHHEVLKNFPDNDAIRTSISRAGGTRIAVHELPYYWYATYEVGPS